MNTQETQLHEKWPDADDLKVYLFDAFIQPVTELGFIPKGYHHQEFPEAQEGLHILTFDPGDELPEMMVSSLNIIMDEGREEDETPYWRYDCATLSIMVPYSN